MFDAASKSKSEHSAAYQMFMLALCLYALGVMAVQRLTNLEHTTAAILNYADWMVCALFFADFLASLRRAERPLRYFFTWGWLDLLSSMPMFDITRWGRIARVVRVVRVLRGLRATREVADLVLRQRAGNALWAAALVGLMLVIFCSIAMLQFENVPGANITSAEDAVWWAFATVTTVGYGDRYPTTTEGRMVAVVLMSAGVALFGTFSAYLAAWFIGPEEEKDDRNIAALRMEIASLRALVERDIANRQQLG